MPPTSRTTEPKAIRIAISRAPIPSWCSIRRRTRSATLPTFPPAAHPVAMVETPSGSDLYVLNQGNNTVSDLSPIDLSTMATIPVSILARVGSFAPGWPAGIRRDPGGCVVFVPSQLYTINTATNAVIPQSPQSVGVAGANFVLYDKSQNRLYVTNPNQGVVYAFDATTDPPTPVGNPREASASLCHRSVRLRLAPRQCLCPWRHCQMAAGSM